MNLEKARALASLNTLQGYHELLSEVLNLKQASLDRLKTAKGREDIIETAMEFRTWDTVCELIRSLPKNALEELKEIGDSIYG